MNTLKLILTILQLLSGLAVTVVVLLQSGKSAGLSGAIAGGAETFLSKGKVSGCKACKGHQVVCNRFRYPHPRAEPYLISAQISESTAQSFSAALFYCHEKKS